MFLWEIINIFFVLVKKSPGGREEPRDTKITDKTQGSMLAMKQKTLSALSLSLSLSLSVSLSMQLNLKWATDIHWVRI